MVLEQFLESETIQKNPIFIISLGLVYALIGYLVANYFFKDNVSVAMLFTCTLLLVPSINIILNKEEQIESIQGTRHFFNNHKDIFKVILFIFFGISLAYLILSLILDTNTAFSYQLDFISSREGLVSDMIDNFKLSDYSPSFDHLLALISNNLLVILIAFTLSIFYGAGSLFLITLNASVFASFISLIFDHILKSSSILILSLYIVPELAGFIFAAMSGSVISRALVRESVGSQGFKNVIKDSLILLLISFVLIVVSGFIEVFISSKLLMYIL